MALHTDIPSRRQIERLLQARGDQLVSIYLPTTPITPIGQKTSTSMVPALVEGRADPEAPRLMRQAPPSCP